MSSMGRADFAVFVEDQRVVAGSKLHGAVYLDAAKVISGSAVVVRLFGEEACVVNYEEGDWSRRKMIPKAFKPVVKGMQQLTECFGDDNNRYERHRSKDANIRILSVEIPVGSESMIANKKIEPGKYKLPFEIGLPASIPASMHVNVEEGHCEIRYMMEAQLEGSGWFKDFKATRDVYVHAKPADVENSIAVPFDGPPDTMSIKQLRCIDVGDMTYACRMDNTVVMCGQSATISMACRNDSSLGVSSVVATLLQQTHWEAGGFESEHEKTIASQTFPKWQELDPLSKEEVQEQKTSTTRDISTMQNEILSSLRSGGHTVSIRVPSNAAPSYEGQLISIKHVLHLRLVSSFFIDALAPCPKVEIPVQVLATDQSMAMPEFDIPVWAQDVANLIVANTVQVSGQAIAYNNIIVEDEEGTEPTTAVDIETAQGEPSIRTLLEVMKKTSNHTGLVQQKLKDARWDKVLSSFTPEEYGSILGQVEVEFQKPSIALALAAKNSKFVCAHVVAASDTCEHWMRVSVIGNLLPHCTDLNTNKHVLLEHLSDWEKLVLQQALSIDNTK